MLRKRFGDITPVKLDIGAWVTSIGETLGAITDIVFCLKTEATDDDADSKFIRYQASGAPVITLSGSVVTVPFALADYGAGLLEIGCTYFIGFGVKFATGGFVEADIDGLEKAEIGQDVIRG